MSNCIESFPNYQRAYVMKARCLTENGEYRQALSVYQSCDYQADSKEAVTIALGSADCLSKLGKYEQALAKLDSLNSSAS
jgi:tetratricopeptide (TPR) repeat protein